MGQGRNDDIFWETILARFFMNSVAKIRKIFVQANYSDSIISNFIAGRSVENYI